MEKTKNEIVKYNYRIFIIEERTDIEELNKFLFSSDNSICGIKYYCHKKDSFIVEVSYINADSSDMLNIEPVKSDNIIYDENNELSNIKPLRPKNKRFYTCQYKLNNENYSLTGSAYTKKQFLDRIYSKQQRLKKKLNNDDIKLLIIECNEITFLEYINLLKK